MRICGEQIIANEMQKSAANLFRQTPKLGCSQDYEHAHSCAAPIDDPI
jgi:hypothetical protein